MVKRKKETYVTVHKIQRTSRFRKTRIKPNDQAKYYVEKKEDQTGFIEKNIDEFVGRGVFAEEFFRKGDFLLKYCGKKILGQASLHLEDSNYTFHFKFQGLDACIDATEEPTVGPRLGRLINHADTSDQLNCVMRLLQFEGVPYLCLFSLRDIHPGEELRYDYGVKNLPWNMTENRISEKKDASPEHNDEEKEHQLPDNEICSKSSKQNDVEKENEHSENEICLSSTAQDDVAKEQNILDNEICSALSGRDDVAKEQNIPDNEICSALSGRDDVKKQNQFPANEKCSSSGQNSDSGQSDNEIIDDSDNDPDFNPVDFIEDSGGDESDCSEIIEIQPQNKCKTIPDIEADGLTKLQTQNNVSTEENVQNVIIPTATAYKDGHRVVDKYHSCVFCGKLQLRIARHLQSVHKNEKEVIEISNKTGKDKAKGLDKLRCEGDYKYNINVLSNNSGSLILARRPSNSKATNYSYADFLPCQFCKGFFLKTEMWRHGMTCQFAPKDKEEHTRVQRNSVLLLESSLPNNQTLHKGFLENVISTLLVDDVSMIIRNDSVILKVGENLYAKHGKQQKQYISQELRLLGRLVLSVRNTLKNESAYLIDVLQPRHFDCLVQASQSLSGIEENDDVCSFKTPSVALKCGPVLKKCCVVLKGWALRKSDDIAEKNAERMLKLIEDEWKNNVTSVALRSLKDAKRNEQVLLPTTTDLVKLKGFFDSEITKATQILKANEENMEHFQRLSSLVLCKITMLNRRRSGETSKILLKDYDSRPQWQSGHNEEIIRSMPLTEQQLVKRLDMIEIRGKRGRNVAVILTPEIKTAIDALVLSRKKVQISEQNLYLFPRASGKMHIAGHVHMRQFASIAGLEFPERIGSTNMRKYIATVVQMLDLKDGELEWLSNHLGHTLNVHKEYYRNQESAIELGKVAKMLLAVDQGHSLSEFKDGVVPDDTIVEDEEEESECEQECSESESEHEQQNVEPKPKSIDIGTRKKKMASQKRAWTPEELTAIKKHFKKNYTLLQVPNKEECERAKSKETALDRRDWKAIKYKVYNDIQLMRKKTKKC